MKLGRPLRARLDKAGWLAGSIGETRRADESHTPASAFGCDYKWQLSQIGSTTAAAAHGERAFAAPHYSHHALIATIDLPTILHTSSDTQDASYASHSSAALAAFDGRSQPPAPLDRGRFACIPDHDR